MAQYTAYMNYLIFFQDAAEYAFAVGLNGSTSVAIAPRDAANLLGIPFPYPTGDISSIPKGIQFFYPFTPGAEFMHPGPTGIFVDDTVASQLVPGQAGNPASIFPTGPDCLFKWSGTIVRSGAGSDPETTAAIPQRRWIGGREMMVHMEGGTGLVETQGMSRDSSRTPDGFGHAIRGTNGVGLWNRTVDQYRVGLTPATSWERFYVRLRVLPTLAGGCGIWRCHGFPSAAAGCGLKINTSGALEAYSISAAGAETLKDTSAALVLNRWYKIDIFLFYVTGATPGRIKIFINGVEDMSYTDSGGTGMNANDRHTSSDLGRWTGGVENNAEIDLTDWICADLPANVLPNLEFDPNVDFSIDWLLGSHVRLHYSDSATTTNWTGTRGALNQSISPQANLLSALTSTTALATIEGVTDVPLLGVQDRFATVYGPVAAIVGDYSSNAAGTDGKLGYKIAGGGAVLTTINQAGAAGSHSVGYLPSGNLLPQEISPFSVVREKSNDANLDTTTALMAVVEYLGTWGPEDDTLQEEVLNRNFLHNCRYANTLWAYLLEGIQSAPTYAVGGTYVGNGGYQEITLPAPCHFLWIRPTAGGTGGIKYFGASLEAHFGGTDRVIPNFRMWTNSAGVTKFSVNGTSVEINQAATTYQYIAFCDPGMRFNICGAFHHAASGAAAFLNLLAYENFTPEGGFAQSDFPGNVSNAVGLWYKGPGFTGTRGTALSGVGTPITDFGSFGLGIFTNGDNLNISSGQVNFSLWRSQEPVCTGIMCQMFTYTGDGTASRVIPVTPAGGRFPLFVLVCADAAHQAVFRDPSHAGANSSRVTSLANIVNGITAGGIDTITVGIDINANGVVYSVFIIPGSDVGWNNGTFFNPNCTGIEPPEILPPQGINVLADGGLILGDIPGGGTALALLQDISGIYTLVPGKHEDTLIDRQTGQSSVDVEIPDPTFKTGYVGG